MYVLTLILPHEIDSIPNERTHYLHHAMQNLLVAS